MKKQGVQVNIMVEKELKEEAAKILEDIGISMSTAITIYLKQIVKTNGIPFEIKK